MTRTIAHMLVPSATYNYIKDQLKQAGYDHAILSEGDGEKLDMHGIALVQEKGVVEPDEVLTLAILSLGLLDKVGPQHKRHCSVRTSHPSWNNPCNCGAEKIFNELRQTLDSIADRSKDDMHGIALVESREATETEEMLTLQLPMQAGVPTQNNRIYTEECMMRIKEQMKGKTVFLQDNCHCYEEESLARVVGVVDDVDSSGARIKILNTPAARDLKKFIGGARLNPVLSAVRIPESGVVDQAELISIGVVVDPDRSKDS